MEGQDKPQISEERRLDRPPPYVNDGRPTLYDRRTDIPEFKDVPIVRQRQPGSPGLPPRSLQTTQQREGPLSRGKGTTATPEAALDPPPNQELDWRLEGLLRQIPQVRELYQACVSTSAAPRSSAVPGQGYPHREEQLRPETNNEGTSDRVLLTTLRKFLERQLESDNQGQRAPSPPRRYQERAAQQLTGTLPMEASNSMVSAREGFHSERERPFLPERYEASSSRPQNSLSPPQESAERFQQSYQEDELDEQILYHQNELRRLQRQRDALRQEQRQRYDESQDLGHHSRDVQDQPFESPPHYRRQEQYQQQRRDLPLESLQVAGCFPPPSASSSIPRDYFDNRQSGPPESIPSGPVHNLRLVRFSRDDPVSELGRHVHQRRSQSPLHEMGMRANAGTPFRPDPELNARGFHSLAPRNSQYVEVVDLEAERRHDQLVRNNYNQREAFDINHQNGGQQQRGVVYGLPGSQQRLPDGTIRKMTKGEKRKQRKLIREAALALFPDPSVPSKEEVLQAIAEVGYVEGGVGPYRPDERQVHREGPRQERGRSPPRRGRSAELVESGLVPAYHVEQGAGAYPPDERQDRHWRSRSPRRERGRSRSPPRRGRSRSPPRRGRAPEVDRRRRR